MSDQRLFDRFVRLCETPSISGCEREVADMVLAELLSVGVEAHEDETQAVTGSGSGNIVARIPGRSDSWVAFFAHLDTVPHADPIEVELYDGVYRSAGKTILAADNKAAVSVIAELAARHAQSQPEIGIELVFTTGEEIGMKGAGALDVKSLRSSFGYALDLPDQIGTIVTSTPTHNQVTAHFKGIEAHAGVNPQDGRSAIVAAAAAVGAMKLGRIAEGTTANVGVVEGGTAFNVVPAYCRVEAEARSKDDETASAVTQSLIDACTWAASEGGCDVDVEVIEKFRGYEMRSSVPGIVAAREAFERCGIEASEVSTGGGSDANALIENGFECILLGNATTNPHTPSETVAAADLLKMLAVCEALVSPGRGTAASNGGGAL